jgi:hypothetical protein
LASPAAARDAFHCAGPQHTPLRPFMPHPAARCDTKGTCVASMRKVSMSAEFRIVHFISDPFLGARIPVAALLRDRTNVVRVVRAQRLPAPECLGGPKYAAALGMVLECLGSAPAFDRLPQPVGPFATMGEPLTVPDGVHDAAKWLGSHVLPTAVTPEWP